MAALFRVTRRTVRRWVHDRLIQPRYRLRGGSCYELVFLEPEVDRFASAYLPSAEDLDREADPRGRNDRKAKILRIRNMLRAYAGKATAARMTKRLVKEYGITEDELDNESAEPATPDRVSSRRGSNYPDRPSSSDRGDEGWDEDVEGKA